MLKSKHFLTMALMALALTACAAAGQRPASGQAAATGQPGATGQQFGGGGRFGREGQAGSLSSNPPTPPVPDVGALELLEVPQSAQRSVEPVPAIDLESQLVTQAYAEVEVARASTPTPVLEAQVANVSGVASTPASQPYVSPLLVTPTPFAPAPPLVVQSHEVLIPRVVNRATCAIANVGECTPTMTAGVTLHLTWTFIEEGPESFGWWTAQVIVTRDGAPFLTHWAANGRETNPPDPEKGEMWKLNVGEEAEFRAGLENVQPGYYTAQLRMCLMTGANCEVGRGWTMVGGDTIQFLIVSG